MKGEQIGGTLASHNHTPRKNVAGAGDVQAPVVDSVVVEGGHQGTTPSDAHASRLSSRNLKTLNKQAEAKGAAIGEPESLGGSPGDADDEIELVTPDVGVI